MSRVTKAFCDKCKKEVGLSYLSVVQFEGGTRIGELCPGCTQKLVQWVGGKGGRSSSSSSTEESDDILPGEREALAYVGCVKQGTHFAPEAVEQGTFPAHIDRDGKGVYRGTVPVAYVSPQSSAQRGNRNACRKNGKCKRGHDVPTGVRYCLECRAAYNAELRRLSQEFRAQRKEVGRNGQDGTVVL